MQISHILQKPSVLALLLANLLPLYLVITGQWSLAQVLLLFWLENVIIGGLNVIKILTSVQGGMRGIPGRLFTAAFFTVHYGMFTLGHGVIIISLFAEQQLPDGIELSPDMVPFIIEYFGLALAGLLLLGSHTVSLVMNYYLGGEYRRLTAGDLMGKPYGRVIILHVTVLVGGLIAQAMGQPLAALVFLVVLKIIVDVASHRREHKALDAGAESYGH